MRVKPIYCLLLKITIITCSAFGNYGFAQDRPEWIDNPGSGAVGSASLHVRGRHAQEELAIARARTRLAARLGVEVNSMQLIDEAVTNDQSSVSSQRKTTQEITNKTVKAFTKALWHDKDRDIIYAWVISVE